jgi:hypothetical protein
MERPAMTYEPKTIAEHIECLARLTGAPASFVDQVRSLFVGKGISLDSEAKPFLGALDEAFRREENVRTSNVKATSKLSRLQQNFKRFGKSYTSEIKQLKQAQNQLREKTRRMRKEAGPGSGNTMHVTIKGDHRTFVTKPVREELPMVPGPEEPQ